MVETGVGTTTYGYDAAGQMTSLQNPFSETTSFTYDDAGRLTKKTFHSGAYTELGYCCCVVTSITHKKSDHTTISSESYVFSDALNLESKTVDGVTTTYTYDAADQLLSESRTGYSASYTYDANGNRASRTVNGTTETYTNDSGDKLTTITVGGNTTKSFTYDAGGRTTAVTVTGVGTTTLAYDYEGRITTITYPDTSTNTFQYNGVGTRVQKVDSGGTRNFTRDGVEVTDPVLSDGAVNYTPALSERRPSVTKYLHDDRLASMKLLTDSSQTATDSREYDAFGNLVSSTGSTLTPFGFVGGMGYQTDSSSGLMLLGHRYYDSSTGRFLTRDPAKDHRNWYSYVTNNPIKGTDPTGLTTRRTPLEEPGEVVPPISCMGLCYKDYREDITDCFRKCRRYWWIYPVCVAACLQAERIKFMLCLACCIRTNGDPYTCGVDDEMSPGQRKACDEGMCQHEIL